MKTRAFRIGVVTAILGAVCLGAGAVPPVKRGGSVDAAQSVDNTSYIDANNILMFVTNFGSFGGDHDGVYGQALNYGTYYPYTGTSDIENGVNDRSILYQAGLWIGGVDSASGDTLVTVSEYMSEHVPGPMLGGTFQTDRPEFRIYKLYRDSLEDNPNADYLAWPVDQGAPVDGEGHPEMRGDQMLWAVYNDADSAQHIVYPGRTAPIGVEVQQTVWASNESGDIELPTPRRLAVTGPADTAVQVKVEISDHAALNGHDYVVTTDTSATFGFVWHLIDVTTSDTLLANQTDFSGANTAVTDGFIVEVYSDYTFASFEVVANASGPINPSLPGALASAGFPTPGEVDPGDDQQVGPGRWAVHCGDNGGSAGGGTRGSYNAFLSRVLRNDAGRMARLGGHDWEMRFTGSYDNPGVGGGWAFNALDNADHGYWVPFELWRSGRGTPDDPSDDLRLIPWIWGDLDGGGDDNFVYDLSQYGSALDATGHDGFEHSASPDDDDPYTDWIYWRIPTDTTPGQAGYLEFEEAMQTDPTGWPGDELPVIDRFVLMNWNGGVTPPFNQDLPEPGTIFRLKAEVPTPGLTFSFRADQTPVRATGPLGLSIYLKYRLINKGSKTMRGCLTSLWVDPDLGTAGDDFVGCDSVTQRFFCYNAWYPDGQYGIAIPAMGFKLLDGPVVPSPGDTAIVDGRTLPDYRDVGMYSFNMFVADLDPDEYSDSYECMMGLFPWGVHAPTPYVYNGDTTRYWLSGEPVAGTGDLDHAPDDRRMMASFGPFDFRPGDTQEVIIKFAVGQGPDRLASLASLYEVLEYVPNVTDVEDSPDEALPRRFVVHPNYPNPFNPSTTIRYALAERADVEVSIFNVLGQKVATLTRKTQAAGEYSIVWNGVDATGRPVASGIYFYRVQAGENMQSRKMMLLK